MKISLKNNFAFLCMPKCASVSIEDMLDPFAQISTSGLAKLRHTNYREYQRYIRPYINERFEDVDLETICIFREPTDWLNSWYKYRSRSKPGRSDQDKSTAHISFSEFIEAYLQDAPPPFADVRCQYDFVKDENGEVGVDKIFLYEDIPSFTNYMEEKVGTSLALKHKNVSPTGKGFVSYYKQKLLAKLRSGKQAPHKKPSNIQLDDDLKDALRERLVKDFELYDSLKQQ
jgi:hypothetical protein